MGCAHRRRPEIPEMSTPNIVTFYKGVRRSMALANVA